MLVVIIYVYDVCMLSYEGDVVYELWVCVDLECNNVFIEKVIGKLLWVMVWFYGCYNGNVQWIVD